MKVCLNAAQIGRQAAQEAESGMQAVLCDWNAGNYPSLQNLESELSKVANAAMRVVMRKVLESFDPGVKEIQWEGQRMRLVETSTKEYLTRFGKVTAKRGLYRPPGHNTASVCPMEIKAGIIGNCWTPGAAYVATLAQTDLTVQQAHRFLLEAGVEASPSSLGRLPAAVSALVEPERAEFEASLREQEKAPAQAQLVCASVDGVMAPMREKTAGRKEKERAPGKHGSGPSGYREIGCATVSLHDAAGDRISTVSYARMPEAKKATVAQQLRDEMLHLYAQAPELRRVYVCDGAEVNWQIAESIEADLRQQCQRAGNVWAPAVQIVDFFHVCQHLKTACDAALGESTPLSKMEFQKLKAKLKELDGGAQCVINALRYREGKANGTAQKRIRSELTYFRNQCSRMNYSHYLQQNLPIGSGVVEAACKTLVTQRMKRSGMSWSQAGGQAILTFNSWCRSNRFDAAWEIITRRILPSPAQTHTYTEPRLKLAA